MMTPIVFLRQRFCRLPIVDGISLQMGEYDRTRETHWWCFRQNTLRIRAWSSVKVVICLKLSHHHYRWQTCRIHPHFLCWMVILSMFWKQAFPCLYYHLLSKYSMAKLMTHLTPVSQHWCISLKKIMCFPVVFHLNKQVIWRGCPTFLRRFCDDFHRETSLLGFFLLQPQC